MDNDFGISQLIKAEEARIQKHKRVSQVNLVNHSKAQCGDKDICLLPATHFKSYFSGH